MKKTVTSLARETCRQTADLYLFPLTNPVLTLISTSVTDRLVCPHLSLWTNLCRQIASLAFILNFQQPVFSSSFPKMSFPLYRARWQGFQSKARWHPSCLRRWAPWVRKISVLQKFPRRRQWRKGFRLWALLSASSSEGPRPSWRMRPGRMSLHHFTGTLAWQTGFINSRFHDASSCSLFTRGCVGLVFLVTDKSLP